MISGSSISIVVRVGKSAYIPREIRNAPYPGEKDSLRGHSAAEPWSFRGPVH